MQACDRMSKIRSVGPCLLKRWCMQQIWTILHQRWPQSPWVSAPIGPCLPKLATKSSCPSALAVSQTVLDCDLNRTRKITLSRPFLLQKLLMKFYEDSGEKVWEGCGPVLNTAHPSLGLTGLGWHNGPAMDDDLDGGLASDDY